MANLDAPASLPLRCRDANESALRPVVITVRIDEKSRNMCDLRLPNLQANDFHFTRKNEPVSRDRKERQVGGAKPAHTSPVVVEPVVIETERNVTVRGLGTPPLKTEWPASGPIKSERKFDLRPIKPRIRRAHQHNQVVGRLCER